MAYGEKLALKVRMELQGEGEIKEQRMFGGLCFLHNGNMLCGVGKDRNLMVRVGPEQYQLALHSKHAREMDFTGKPMKGLVYISPSGYRTKTMLAKWIFMGLCYTNTLPAKKK